MERLQKIIAEYGYASRRKAEELIKHKRVLVNGKVITELGTKVDYNDVISIDGVIINKDVPHYSIHPSFKICVGGIFVFVIQCF